MVSKLSLFEWLPVGEKAGKLQAVARTVWNSPESFRKMLRRGLPRNLRWVLIFCLCVCVAFVVWVLLERRNQKKLQTIVSKACKSVSRKYFAEYN